LICFGFEQTVQSLLNRAPHNFVYVPSKLTLVDLITPVPRTVFVTLAIGGPLIG
jgi:hypothetical protein